MLVCRYDKDANPNSCPGCLHVCVDRKPATMNKDFEKAIKDMEEGKVNNRKRFKETKI